MEIGFSQICFSVYILVTSFNHLVQSLYLINEEAKVQKDGLCPVTEG